MDTQSQTAQADEGLESLLSEPEAVSARPPSGEPAPAADDLADLLGEIEAMAMPPAELPPQPADDLDGLLDELNAASARSDAPAPTEDDLDAVLGEIAVAAPLPPPPPPAASLPVPPPAPVPVASLAMEDDDLDGLLDALDGFDEEKTGGDDFALDDLDEFVAPALPAPVQRFKFKPSHRMLALVGAGLLASHAALFGLGFWLGDRKTDRVEVVHVRPVIPVPKGVMRYVGHPADFVIDGHVIFTAPEVRAAVEELAGGQDLAEALDAFSRRMKPLGAVTSNGKLLEASACDPEACASTAFSLRYDSQSHKIWVCQTVPYLGGTAQSYRYGEEGMVEVPRCVDAGPEAVPDAVPEASEAAASDQREAAQATAAPHKPARASPRETSAQPHDFAQHAAREAQAAADVASAAGH